MKKLLLASVCLFPVTAHALTTPLPHPGEDEHIVYAEYSPGKVYLILVPYGGETGVVLSPQELAASKFCTPGGAQTVPANRSVQATQGGQDNQGGQDAPAWAHDSKHVNMFIFMANQGALPTYKHCISTFADGTTRNYTFLMRVVDEPPESKGGKVADNATAEIKTDAQPKTTGYATVFMTYEKDDKSRKIKRDIERAQQRRAELIATSQARRIQAADLRAKAELKAAASKCYGRHNFMWRGDAEIIPVSACDNGAVTEFTWPGQMPAPAISLGVCEEKREKVVTQAPNPDQPGAVVVPTISRWWCLRQGSDMVAELYDATFNSIGQNLGTGTVSPYVRATVAR